MLVVIPFCHKDRAQAELLADWLLELGPYPNHELLVVRDHRAPAVPKFVTLFRSADEVVVTDDAHDRWPFSANNMIRHAGKHIEFSANPQPWLWLESDCVPLREGWLDVIEAEYKSAGKLFMGALVNVPGVAQHMSGIGVYAARLSHHAGDVYMADNVMAFDCFSASQILPQAHFTKLIQHLWRRDPVTTKDLNAPFESWDQVQRDIAPETVLYHSCKDDSLIRLLREHRNNLSVDVQPEIKDKASVAGGLTSDSSNLARKSTANRMENSDSRGGQFISASDRNQTVQQATASDADTFTCSIFIKSWEGDRAWLHYCLRSIEKFATGFKEVILILPEGMTFVNPLCEIIHVHEESGGEDGYLRQQAIKMNADAATDSTHICFVDSDTIFTRPVTPETYFTDGKVAWMMTPWAKTNTPWQPIVEKFLGQPVEYEFMRRLPVLCPSWLLATVRQFCVKQHNVTLDQYIMAQPHRDFTEFNVLGAFAYAFHRERFHWINTEEVPESEWPPLTVLQKFSWDGLTPEIEAEFEAILSGGMESRHAESPGCGSNPGDILQASESGYLAIGSVSGSSAPPTQATFSTVSATTVTGFLDDAQNLAERLKALMTNSAKTRQIHLVLHKAGVIKLPYRFSKRKGWRKKSKRT